MPAEKFRWVLRAEWTKLRSVLGTVGCLAAAMSALLGVALLISSGNPGTFGDADYVDEFRIDHRPLDGDGTLVARVRSMDSSHPWAMAGILVKQSLTSGSPYAALFLTPRHGVRLQANFTVDAMGSRQAASRYLKLIRAGDRITGYESADGAAWTEVGSATLPHLPRTVEVGLFVTGPGLTRVQPMRPTVQRTRPTTAHFDQVALTPATPGGWTAARLGGEAPSEPGGPDAAGVFTLFGDGDIIRRSDDGSRVIAATAGTIFAILPAIALGVLAMTAEYRWRLGWVTFTAGPRRGRVLAAKAIVVATATFGAGLAATLVGFLVIQPRLRGQGFGPPTYPDPSLLDPATFRVLAGTAGFLALLALVSLGVATIVRRSAGAITAVAAAVFVPIVVLPFLPETATIWLQRVVPLAGLSLQQLRETDDTFLLPWVGHPWAGALILGGYAAVTLGLGYWRLRRSDV
ncbi:ABC transporter permease subunit [Cryptosporangium aurantiacum]|uniref:ABC-type transport system involved in multi-copper enzyme maturation, permease component n=1 Tax=Cryptosporangium aurantiacum TaxID=134849 RepID=A0A1M7RMF1_9ACTN|nr:ABC transporter permease subunit [Cryptosporangium aurantiacum]SHN47360.1 ABC-type transport system involved in multi-copper enzyme maturation, permease component [Cryptosporangium aurantiacum]